eukprot:Protomagalhaensia_wolfi_Nauph_80__4169@NODE_423_length_2545_cov_454_310056_g61_i1_p1_GENE_NODE_423_length_2545_cov_454_310056_g61_i1NODE_423_length_2545_cov_454_310056_g61_i1_p1_ORF_typecomplete_len211_score18_64zfCCCH/PF00642_24/1_3e08zfCCCH/PF00642_24/0_015zfCCCH_3/PF15663_5/8_5e11zf_CCCH_4/PF18345_1/2e08zf_CCCH_4/PF18345_1/4_2e02zf_CCCH_4/PF18345_1/5e02Torus/PF16131_5/0_019Torus/PF16131_5/0_06zfCCCH_4/PF18044_1/9_9e06zfCCCH_4/PF18044_1/1_6e03zfCCCH_4/PF18044_1/3_3e03zfCCCH_2/PF14608_6/0_0091z
MRGVEVASSGMTAQRLQCFKTKRCRFWLENRCSRGDKCTYAHTDVELRCPPDLTKTKICTRWKRGVCEKTPTQCAYAHGVEDLRSVDELRSAAATAESDASPQIQATATREEPSPPQRPVVPKLRLEPGEFSLDFSKDTVRSELSLASTTFPTDILSKDTVRSERSVASSFPSLSPVRIDELDWPVSPSVEEESFFTAAVRAALTVAYYD